MFLYIKQEIIKQQELNVRVRSLRLLNIIVAIDLIQISVKIKPKRSLDNVSWNPKCISLTTFLKSGIDLYLVSQY